MSNYLLVLAILCKGLSFLFFFLALILYKPPDGQAKVKAYPSLPGKTSSVNSTLPFLSSDMSVDDLKLSPLTNKRTNSDSSEKCSEGGTTPKAGRTLK